MKRSSLTLNDTQCSLLLGTVASVESAAFHSFEFEEQNEMETLSLNKDTYRLTTSSLSLRCSISQFLNAACQNTCPVIWKTEMGCHPAKAADPFSRHL